MNSDWLKKISNIKKFSLISSKIISLIFCLFLMTQYKTYTLSFNIPKGLLEYSYIKNTAIYLDSIGLFFLVIPITLIVASFYFTENRFLGFISALFSFFTNIFSVSLCYLKGTLQEVLNTKIFIIHNIISLETKRNLFKAYLEQKIQDLPFRSQELINFIQKDITTNFTALYEPKLKLLRTSDIPPYVETLLMTLQRQFKNNNFISDNNSSISFVDILTNSSTVKVIGGIIVIIGGFLLLKYMFSNNEHHTTHAKISADITQNSKETTNSIDALINNNNSQENSFKKVIEALELVKNQIIDIHKNNDINDEKLKNHTALFKEFKDITNKNALILAELTKKNGNYNVEAIYQDVQTLGSRLTQLEGQFAQAVAQSISNLSNDAVNTPLLNSISNQQKEVLSVVNNLISKTQETEEHLQGISKNTMGNIIALENNIETQFNDLQKKVDENSMLGEITVKGLTSVTETVSKQQQNLISYYEQNEQTKLQVHYQAEELKTMREDMDLVHARQESLATKVAQVVIDLPNKAPITNTSSNTETKSIVYELLGLVKNIMASNAELQVKLNDMEKEQTRCGANIETLADKVNGSGFFTVQTEVFETAQMIAKTNEYDDTVDDSIESSRHVPTFEERAQTQFKVMMNHLGNSYKSLQADQQRDDLAALNLALPENYNEEFKHELHEIRHNLELLKDNTNRIYNDITKK